MPEDRHDAVAAVAGTPDWVQEGDGMSRLRWGVRRFGRCASVAAIAAACWAGVASADVVSIGGDAAGRTIPLGNGTFRVVGTFSSADTSAKGNYNATYVEDTVGYTSCDRLGFGVLDCFLDPAAHQCNLIHGQITVNTSGNSVSLPIGADGFQRVTSAVCLDPDHPGQYVVHLDSAVDTLPPGGVETKGYGTFTTVFGHLTGTAAPLGNVYADSLTLGLTLIRPDGS
jgi:hypothetical protein